MNAGHSSQPQGHENINLNAQEKNVLQGHGGFNAAKLKRNNRNKDQTGQKPLETIQLNAQEREALLGRMNGQARKQSQQLAGERRALRMEYNVARVLFIMSHGAGPEVRHVTIPRNLSKRGIALLFGRFVYPDTPCKVAMPNLEGQWVLVSGKVIRSSHVDATYHETCIVFDEPIDLRDFIELSRDEEMLVREELDEELGRVLAEAEVQHERVLIVDTDKATRRLLSHHLNTLDVHAYEASSESQAIRLAQQHSMDMVFADTDLGEQELKRLIEALREAGYQGPVVGTSIDDDEATQQRITESGCCDFMAKPYSFDAIQTTVVKHTSKSDGDASPIYSSFNEDDQMQPLINEFVSMVNGNISKLNDARNSGDQQQIQQLCKHLKGSGASYGFDTVTELAATILTQLDADQDEVDKLNDSVTDLIQTLRRIRT